jgi:OPA family glycerol-3-phosphate transporter-like MFS transporter
MYLALPQLLKIVSWRILMLSCAFVGLGIMVVWVIVNPKLLKERVLNSKISGASAEARRIKPPSFVYIPIALIMLGIILQGVLRDGVQNWMPFYLSESFGIPESDAITSTVLLALFSVISFAVFDVIHRKLFKNEVFCASMIFALSIAASFALYLFSLFFNNAVIPMLLMAIIVASMHGINLMLITVVPKRFIKSGRVSTYSGILNACTYIGAALSSYGFAVLAENFGWSFTILSWVFVSIAGFSVCMLATPMWKRFRREYSDNENV